MARCAARRRVLAPCAVALLLAVLPAFLPTAEAQVPAGSRTLQVIMSTDRGSAVIERLTSQLITVNVRDASLDTRLLHVVTLSAQFEERDHGGWSVALSPTTFYMNSGQEVTASLLIITSAVITQPYVHVRVTADMRGFDTQGSLSPTQNSTATALVAAQLAPYYASQVQIKAQPQRVGPYEQLSYPVTIQNLAPFPDKYRIDAAVDKPGYVVSVQPGLILNPGETREVSITLLTPKDKLFFPGEAGIVTVNVRSENDPQVIYSANTVVTVEGVYVPGYWFPLLALGAVLAVPAIQRANDAFDRRRKESGKPTRALTEGEEIELATLKLTDPEEYKRRSQKHADHFRARLAVWREQRKKRAKIAAAIRAKQREEARLLLARQKEIAHKRKALEKEKERQVQAALAEALAADKVAAKAAALEAKQRAREERANAKVAIRDNKRKAKLAAALLARKEKLEAKVAKERLARIHQLEKEKRRREKALEKERRRSEKG